MRNTIKKLVELLDYELRFPEPIFEFGSRQPKGQEKNAIKDLFHGRTYVGCDAEAGLGVDKVLDLHALDLPDNSVGTAIILDTVEHVKYFWKAAPEIYRALKPGGIAIFTSVMYFPIHNFPSDYWRFSPDGFKCMTEMFTESFIEYAGLKDFPHTVVSINIKGSLSEEKRLLIERTLKNWKRFHSQSWKEFATLLLPPVILVPLYKLYVKLFEQN